jgi:outer membrane receptor protein involved in Fe transport
LDGGSASGSQAGLTGFPKIDFSYVAIDQDHPVSVLTLFRPRLSLGYAGTQPSPTDKLRIFNLNGINAGQNTIVSLDGGATQVPLVRLSTLGNTHLRPERTSEVEGGFDAGFGNDRLQLTVTYYNKTRHDAIIRVPVPPSVSGRGAAGTAIMKNIGVVRNTGTELTANVRVLDNPLVGWIVNANLSQDRNRVVRLNPGESTIIVGNSRIEAGYPLWSKWAQPVVSYADANHNGIIDYNEVRLGDSAVFVGQNEPNYLLNVSNAISLWQGRLSMTFNLAYMSGLTQAQGSTGAGNGILINLPNTPNTSLATEAAVVVSTLNDGSPSYLGSTVSTIGTMQKVNVLRFNSLSINYILPANLLKRLRIPTMELALQGSNLGLHTNYRGIDPNVNSSSTTSGSGDVLLDAGQLPQPRSWSLLVRIGN